MMDLDESMPEIRVGVLAVLVVHFYNLCAYMAYVACTHLTQHLAVQGFTGLFLLVGSAYTLVWSSGLQHYIRYRLAETMSDMIRTMTGIVTVVAAIPAGITMKLSWLMMDSLSI